MQQAGLPVPQASGSVAANSSAGYGDGEVIIAACNARALSGDEWEQVTPWGDFPNPQGLQRLNKKTGQQMVDAFNSSRTTLGVPIFRGHPDVDPKNYPDDRRYGKITALDARSDGLWCKPAFNDLGRQNKDQGYWVYPSGVWKFKRMPGGVIEPTELLSVGLTNSPIIPTVKPWAKNSAVADDLDDNPAIRAVRLLYRESLRTQNSIIQATTSGAAKREAKAALKDHQDLQEGYSALTAIAQKQDELMREKGMPAHEALLHAQVLLPQSAASAAAHLHKLDNVRKAENRRANLKDFQDAVNQRMARGLSFHQAWSAEKADRKIKNEWTPDDD